MESGLQSHSDKRNLEFSPKKIQSDVDYGRSDFGNFDIVLIWIPAHSDLQSHSVYGHLVSRDSDFEHSDYSRWT